jgi:diguanylate cyclase (GGDEF)-like protein
MLAQLVSDMIRSEDLLARYGGEEFVLLARDADEEKAFLFGTRIRKAVENYEFVFEGRRIPITISAGVATLNKGNFSDSAMMFQEADRQLYKAKEGGRNRVASILTG